MEWNYTFEKNDDLDFFLESFWNQVFDRVLFSPSIQPVTLVVQYKIIKSSFLYR